MNQWPEHIERWLSLRKYRELGIMTIGGGIIALMVGCGLYLNEISITLNRTETHQHFTIDPYEVKNNTPAFNDFLSGIQHQNGVLVLGTSESGGLNGQNYFHFLNSDTSLQQKFSFLGGAGRYAEVFIPLIAEEPRRWKGLNVLLYVNPTYWRKNLNQFRNDYFLRYIDPRLVAKHRTEFDSLNLWELVYAPYFSKQPPLKVETMALSLKVDALRQVFVEGNRQHFQPSVNPFGKFPKPLKINDQLIEKLRDKIDSDWNVSHRYKKQHARPTLPEIDTTSTYRYDVIEAMIKVCKHHGVKLHIALGSYNGLLGKAAGQDSALPPYEAALTELRALFAQHNIAYTDLSDLSYVSGSYRDYQHHSNYGAYLKYLKLKAAYETH